jgi:hypothetical protein
MIMSKSARVREAEERAASIGRGLDTIADSTEQMIPKITTAYESRDWETLGYAAWDSYVQDRFGDKLLRLTRPGRESLALTLNAAGFSTRAIAPVIGVSKSTVAELVSAGVQNRTPEDSKTIGIDGKVYPRDHNWRPGCKVGNERIEKNLARIHKALDQLDWEGGDVTPVFVKHLAEIAEHAAAVRSHYDEHGNRIAAWPDGSVEFTTFDPRLRKKG